LETPRLKYVIDKTSKVVHDMQVTEEYIYTAENYNKLIELASVNLAELDENNF